MSVAHPKPVWPCRLALLLALPLAAVPSRADAQAASGATTAPPPGTAQARPPLVSLGDLKLRLPWQYEYPRPLNPAAQEDVAVNWIGFTFWMPDLSAPKGDVFFKPGYTEPGRSASDHLVKVTEMRRSRASGGSGGPKPADQIQNLTSPPYTYEFVEDRGLTHILQQPGSQEMGMPTWFDLRDPKTTYVVSCFADLGLPNNLCDVSLALDDWGVQLKLLIPARSKYEVPTMAAGIRTLLSRWAEKT